VFKQSAELPLEMGQNPDTIPEKIQHKNTNNDDLSKEKERETQDENKSAMLGIADTSNMFREAAPLSLPNKARYVFRKALILLCQTVHQGSRRSASCRFRNVVTTSLDRYRILTVFLWFTF
jgi:hypothetical protein